MKQKMIIIGLAMGLTMVSQQTQSLGMGKIQVHSALDQPLQANIDLMMGEGDDFSEITVAIASAADYKKVGLDRSFVPNNIQVALDEENPLTINVTSTGPVTEPIVSLLLDVNWGNGRILREFTILLDPPVYQTSQSVIVNTYQDTDDAVYEAVDDASEPGTSEETDVSESVVQTREEASQSENVTEAETVDTADEATETSTEPAYQTNFGDITVSSGDTLWSLANSNKPSNISTHQMMMALFNKNPHAFANNNINQLNKGSVLSIPTLQDIEQLSQTEAMQMAQSHNDSWSPAASESSDYSSFQTTTDYTEPAAEDTSSIDYGVELSGGDDSNSSDGDGDTSGSSASDDTMAEELYNKESENIELKDRVNELESLVEQQQAALEVKSDDMANFEEQMATANDSDTEVATDANAEETDDVWGDEFASQDDATESTDGNLSIDEVNLVDGGDAGDSAVAEEGFEPETETADDSATTSNDESTEPATTTMPSFSGAQSQPETSMVDTAINWVMDHLKWVLMGLVGLLLLIFVPRMVSGRNKDVTEETSFLDDIKSKKRSQEADEEAGESLPEDTKVNEPLTEDSDDVELDDPEDDVLAELDKKIDFDAEMDDDEDIFKGFDDEEGSDKASNEGEEDQEDDDDGFDLDGFLSDEIDDADDSAEKASDQDEESLFDEDLDDVITKDLSEEASQATEQAEELDEDFDFDLSELDGLEDESNKAKDELASEIDEAVSELTGDEDAESEEDMDFSLDDDSFDLDLDEETAEEAVEEGVSSSEDEFDEMLDINEDAAEDLQVESEETIDDSDLDLGLDLDDMMEDGDVIDTKMDLAKAYLEMGDNDGARNLLKEVAAEGNESQIEEAKKLLDDM